MRTISVLYKQLSGSSFDTHDNSVKMFGFTFVAVALLDELSFWLRCYQLRREAREAAERWIELLEREWNLDFNSARLGG